MRRWPICWPTSTTTCWSILPDPQRRAIDFVLLRGPAEPAVTDYRATGAALLSVLDRLADHTPVLLAIDDLQWMDSSTAQVADFALRRLSSPVAVLAALRSPGDSDQELPLLQSDPDRIHRVRVGPLSLGALHQMLRTRTGSSFPRPALTRIAQISGGNPFYALELAWGTRREGPADPASPLPQTLAQLVRIRIDGIRPDVQPALLAAAALGEPTVELIQFALDTGPAEAERLLEAAEDYGVITLDGHRVRFTHPLLATGVYTAASPARRRGMHRRLAELTADPEERARHIAQAATRLDAASAAALDQGAARARARGAPAAAAELLELAIKLGGETHLSAGSRWPTTTSTPVTRRGPARCWRKRSPGCPRARARAGALQLLAVVRLHDDSYRESAGCLEQALRRGRARTCGYASRS